MAEPGTRRAWWRQKRLWAAAVALFAVAYPLSLPPIFYLAVRGWIPMEVHLVVGSLGRWLATNPVLRAAGYKRYADWWTFAALPELAPPNHVPDPAVDRTHWAPPSDDGINRTTWTPPMSY